MKLKKIVHSTHYLIFLGLFTCFSNISIADSCPFSGAIQIEVHRVAPLSGSYTYIPPTGWRFIGNSTFSNYPLSPEELGFGGATLTINSVNAEGIITVVNPVCMYQSHIDFLKITKDILPTNTGKTVKDFTTNNWHISNNKLICYGSDPRICKW